MAKYTKYKKRLISRLELLRMKHRALRMKKYIPMQRMSPRISTSIWNSPRIHSFSRPLSPINKEYMEVEERSEKKEMNWAQAKRAFPKLRPFSDADKDGIYNMFDCKPFNKKKQGPEHEDQLGWKGGVGEKIASRNLSRIGGNYNVERVERNEEPVERVSKIEQEYDDKRSSRFIEDRDNDQIGFDDDTASKNITDITKRYKNKPF